jgi:soluble cytochrome b562
VAAQPQEEASEGTQPGQEAPETVASNEWGRVDAAGEVFVRTAGGERSVGSWQVGQPEQALAFFGRKFADLAVQVDLLEQRLESGAAAPDEIASGVRRLRDALTDAKAVGDLDALSARLDVVDAHVAERRAERRQARAKAQDEAMARKEAIAEAAEAIAEGNDWRHGADRLRSLLDEWKSLARLNRATDDALWRRFSTARTHYTRRRKAHFAELADRRETARVIKERILSEAEELATSTDWGATSRQYRDLMAEWKAAGPAPRNVEDMLWKRFRAAQDTFFEARAAHQAQRDDEEQANLRLKEELLTEAEALLPVSDWKSARAQLRSIQERWEQIGYVPRDARRGIEGRLRSVEDAVRQAEESEWKRSNPEAYARAQDTVDQLQALIADLEQKVEKARASGDERKLREAEEALAARRTWLEQAEQARDEFAG